MSKPVLAAGLLLTAAGAWYWALRPVAMPREMAAREARASGAADIPYVRLDQLGTSARVLPRPAGRDPFRTRHVVAAVPGAPSSAAAPGERQATAPAQPSGPVWPHLELIGLAEGREGAAVVRTAILSGPRGVHHVRAGELVEQVYRLDRVAVDGVDLRLLPEDRLIRLALRP